MRPRKGRGRKLKTESGKLKSNRVSVDSESHSAFRVLHAVFQLSAFPQLAGFVLAGAALPVDYLALCASRDSRTRETASLPVSFVYSEFLDAAERRRSATVGEVHAPPER